MGLGNSGWIGKKSVGWCGGPGNSPAIAVGAFGNTFAPENLGNNFYAPVEGGGGPNLEMRIGDRFGEVLFDPVGGG